MKRHFENLTVKVGRVIRHWWLLMLAGIFCVAAGIVVFVFPMESYMTLSIIFGVLMLIVSKTSYQKDYDKINKTK